MPKIKVQISELDYDGMTWDDECMPETAITIEAEDVHTLGQLEGLFKAAALAAGFDYVGRCVLHKRVSILCEGDEVKGGERAKLEELLKEGTEDEIL